MGLPWHRRYRRTVLPQAVWAVQAGQLLPSGRGLVDLSGNGNHAYFGGNSTSPTTNDPTALPWRGQKEVWFPGTTGNYLSTTKYIPSGGVFRIEADITASDYTNSDQVIASVYDSAGGKRAWRFLVDPSGFLRVNLSSNGTAAAVAVSSSIAIPVSDGQRIHVAAEINLSNGTINFYTSSNGVSWSALGAQISFTPLSLFDADTPLAIGAQNVGSSGLFGGRMRYVRLYQDGVQVRGCNAALCAEPYATVADEVSGTWTLNRSSSGLKLAVVDEKAQTAGAGALEQFGTDDFDEVANSVVLDASPSFTAWAVVRIHGTPAANSAVLAKKINLTTAAGWAIYLDTSRKVAAVVGDGSSSVTETSASAIPAGVAVLIALVRRGGKLHVWANGVLSAGTADALTSVTNTEVLRTMRLSGAGTSYADGAVFARGVCREALSADDLRRLAQELGVTP